MRFVLTALIFLAGLFDLFMAISFLVGPQDAGQTLAVAPMGIAGLSTMRADFTAFFGVAAFCMMWGAWRRNGDLLLVPGLLFAVALSARALNLLVVGPYFGWAIPMLVEAFHVVILFAAWHLLQHHRLEEIAA